MTNGPATKTDCEIATAGAAVRRVVRIINPLGVHWRVAERFSRTAKGYTASVVVRHADHVADGRSPTDLILLVALPGADVVIETTGPDAVAAADELVAILASPTD